MLVIPGWVIPADINSKSLAKVGITVDSKSGKLSVDEDTFKKADSTKVDALFKGNGSYAYAVASKASMLEYAAKNEAEKTNTYGANGRYTQAYNSGYNYNMFLYSKTGRESPTLLYGLIKEASRIGMLLFN